ncbi:hypothetical protein DSCO28_03770 [Desulfosarcina ovata subsp. sediminis]|uniref:Uncharacterized protein n=1 Tax=Desulfosarcina ovata subsp. sediminis TaxID=885957 RepID=A0A5K7ZFW3_9BACT|nr:Ada metal-binding domain-containing protein [Desulfosarcina ovata]BBO79811.1 hypothetical protein DSCO28_03770 [Desulfosarcina ovata subsp. sediminis]
MQIKRFEAADMNDGLRMVKREFGDDAIILSAKEARPGGFFGALRKKHVVITAAMDYQTKETRQSKPFSGLLSEQLDDAPPADQVSLSGASPSSHAIPSNRPAAGPPLTGGDEKMTDRSKQRVNSESFSETQRLVSNLSAMRRYGDAQMPMSENPETEIMNSDPKAFPIFVEPFYRHQAVQQRIAFVGPSGAGKSSMVAKLAQHCRKVENKSTGLISLDRFRLGANTLLENAAKIMNLPFVLVRNADQLQDVLADYSKHDVVLIDTPGMGKMDQDMFDTVRSLLKHATPDEIHLVVNATVRQAVIAAAVKNFSTLDANRLLPTHLDEYDCHDAATELYEATHLASAFQSIGVDLFDGFKEIQFEPKAASKPSFFAARQAEAKMSTTRGHTQKTVTAQAEPEAEKAVQYLANRNSELFHHPSCKSVKRINRENIIVFESIDQAIDEGFKPCRACCNLGMIKPSTFQPYAYQRANAL